VHIQRLEEVVGLMWGLHKNLEYNLYFYERQKELHQLREDIKNGDTEMLSQEQYDKEIKQFFADLKR